MPTSRSRKVVGELGAGPQFDAFPVFGVRLVELVGFDFGGLQDDSRPGLDFDFLHPLGEGVKLGALLGVHVFEGQEVVKPLAFLAGLQPETLASSHFIPTLCL